MPVPTVIKTRTGNIDIDRIGDALRDIQVWLSGCDILDGRLIVNQVLATGASGNTITHRLGRAYKGYVVVKNTDYTLTHADQPTLADTALFINIRASVACTVTLWVF